MICRQTCQVLFRQFDQCTAPVGIHSFKNHFQMRFYGIPGNMQESGNFRAAHASGSQLCDPALPLRQLTGAGRRLADLNAGSRETPLDTASLSPVPFCGPGSAIAVNGIV